jgi:hypothetical protein
MVTANDGLPLAGPVRWYKDHKEQCIIVETTKDNAPATACGLHARSVQPGEARVIVAIRRF